MAEKEAYRQKVEAQLNEWRAQIRLLEAKAEKAGAEANIEFRKQVEALRGKEQAAEKRLAELQNAAEESWEGLKSKIEGAWTDLKSSLDKVTSKFK